MSVEDDAEISMSTCSFIARSALHTSHEHVNTWSIQVHINLRRFENMSTVCCLITLNVIGERDFKGQLSKRRPHRWCHGPNFDLWRWHEIARHLPYSARCMRRPTRDPRRRQHNLCVDHATRWTVQVQHEPAFKNLRWLFAVLWRR